MAHEIRALPRFIQQGEPAFVVRLEINPRHILRALQDGFARLDRGRGSPVDREETDDAPDDQHYVNRGPSQRAPHVELIARSEVTRAGSAHVSLNALSSTSRRRRGRAGQQKSTARL